MKARRASSLVEIVVVLTAFSAVLTTSAVLLHRMMHLHGKTRSFLSAQRNALRLSDQLREDVHRAEAVLENDPPNEAAVRLRLPGMQSVEYRHESGVVRRILSADDQVVSREEFTFPAESKVEFRKSESPRRVELTIINDPTASPPEGEGTESTTVPSFAVPVHLHVEARLGRDAKYREPPRETETSP